MKDLKDVKVFSIALISRILGCKRQRDLVFHIFKGFLEAEEVEVSTRREHTLEKSKKITDSFLFFPLTIR